MIQGKNINSFITKELIEKSKPIPRLCAENNWDGDSAALGVERTRLYRSKKFTAAARLTGKIKDRTPRHGLPRGSKVDGNIEAADHRGTEHI